jgi:glycosyltransferase involved in cell wall biosynthesis
MWLCGPGDIEMVNKYSSKDNRIIYKGCLTHKDVLNLQKQVRLLVNPRHSYDKFTLYSFPSKTMEYMASGTPTLMSRLKSLPKDYLDHLYLFEDESIEGMSKMIKHCLDKPDAELNDFGAAAAEFILSNKTPDIQAQKLFSFLSQI